VRLQAIAAAVAILCASPLYEQDLPDWVLQLSRVKRKAKAELQRLPDFACAETINRFERRPRTDIYRPIDTVRLDVAFVGGKEMVAPAGGTGSFQEMDLKRMAYGGAMGTGAFSAVARNLFVNDNGRTTAMVEDRILDRPALRFSFVVPVNQAGYTISSATAVGSVGLEGTFWADAENHNLLRIEERAVDIPLELDIADTTTVVTYAMTKIGPSEVLLPRSARTILTNTNGWQGRNEIEFTNCREYVAESVIRFDTDAPPPKKK